MPRSTVEEYVWRRLSARKWGAGRRLCDRLTRRCIRAWQRDVPRPMAIERQVEAEARSDVQMGILASWLLSAVISEIVRALWQWWNESHANRCLMFAYQRELPDDLC